MIIFKNLLVEDGEEDFCYGVLLKDESVYCLCGCDGLFEKGDYAIISANVDTGSNIPYQTILSRRKTWFLNGLRVNKKCLSEYGYLWEGMHGITARIGKLLFQYNVETYRLYEDNTEGVVGDFCDFDSHKGWFGVEVDTLEKAIESGMLDDFFFEDWADDIRLRKKKLNTYVVCMNSEYVRDAQMLDTKEMSVKEFEEIDWQSSELDEFWHDMEPIPFIGVVEAVDKEIAIAIAARKYRYDERCLYVAKEIKHVSQNKDVYHDLFFEISRLPKSEIKKKLGDVLFEVVTSAKQKEGYSYIEPSELEKIKVLRKRVESVSAYNEKVIGDKIHGAWVGRICGCMLGKTVEGIRTNELVPFLKETNNYPMHRYIYRSDLTEETVGKYKFGFMGRCYADEIDGMPVDDDTNYVVLAQEIIKTFGRDFTPFDVANAWLKYQGKDA